MDETEAGALERFYARLARWLYPWRSLLWIIGLAACAGFAYLVFDSAGDLDPHLMTLSVAVALWVLGLLTIIHGFVDPPPKLEGTGVLAGLRRRMARLVRRAMALLMTAVAAVVVVVSVRALVLAARGLAG